MLDILDTLLHLIGAEDDECAYFACFHRILNRLLLL